MTELFLTIGVLIGVSIGVLIGVLIFIGVMLRVTGLAIWVIWSVGMTTGDFPKVSRKQYAIVLILSVVFPEFFMLFVIVYTLCQIITNTLKTLKDADC